MVKVLLATRPCRPVGTPGINQGMGTPQTGDCYPVETTF